MSEVKSIFVLTAAEIREAARNLAENGAACEHHYQVGSVQAAIFERAYVLRQRELDDDRAVV